MNQDSSLKVKIQRSAPEVIKSELGLHLQAIILQGSES